VLKNALGHLSKESATSKNNPRINYYDKSSPDRDNNFSGSDLHGESKWDFNTLAAFVVASMNYRALELPTNLCSHIPNLCERMVIYGEFLNLTRGYTSIGNTQFNIKPETLTRR